MSLISGANHAARRRDSARTVTDISFEPCMQYTMETEESGHCRLSTSRRSQRRSKHSCFAQIAELGNRRVDRSVQQMLNVSLGFVAFRAARRRDNVRTAAPTLFEPCIQSTMAQWHNGDRRGFGRYQDPDTAPSEVSKHAHSKHIFSYLFLSRTFCYLDTN